MHIYLGFSLPEVADELGIPLGTAKSRLNRSLAALRFAVEGELDPVSAGIREKGQLA
jgi:RNA polymerase sigma-70 factor (ECF subfamily)